MNISRITPSTKSLNEVTNGMKKYLSEISHEYLNRAAILPEIKVSKDVPSSYAYFSPTTPIMTRDQSVDAGQVIDFIF